MDRVSIQLLGGFSVTVNGVRRDSLFSRSRKGTSLMICLVLQNGKPVSIQRLIREIWNSRVSSNPENALKTMVSRLRAILNEASPGLGNCIQAQQGGYSWVNVPGAEVDVITFLRLTAALRETPGEEERLLLYRRIMEVYRGDLTQTGDLVNGVIQSSWLHREYLEAAYAYVRWLQKNGQTEELCRVCRQGLQVDELDDFFRIELIRAEAENASGQTEAEESPPAVYQRMADTGIVLQGYVDEIRSALTAWDRERKGPFFCDFEAFRQICTIQMNNLERLGSSLFLGVIMVAGRDQELSSFSRESAMAGLQEILRRGLRKGDIVTRYAADSFAVLLPTVDYTTGSLVIERIENAFYQEYANHTVVMRHRISSLVEIPLEEAFPPESPEN